MTTLFILMVSIITITFILEQVMQYLNGKSWTGILPEKVADLYNGEEYTKAQNYDFEKKKFIINGNILTEKLNKIKLFEHFKMELKRLSL
jgi:hypothetical protein